MTRQKQRRATEKPLTKGMVITWGKLVIAILGFLIPTYVAVYNFAGNSRASEMTIKSEVSELKSAASEWKQTMTEANKAFKDLTITVVRLDEKLKATDQREDNHEQRIQHLEEGTHGRNTQ